jgi:ABC-type cobalamin/Fe3+-siderophores transport system ATPase subunit
MRRDALAPRDTARPWQSPVQLEIDGLALEAGGRTLLHGLSATLAAGQRWVVLGPNGAGKSTLIAALAGLLDPAAGGLRLQSRALHGWSPAALAAWRAWCPAGWTDPFPLRVDEALRGVAAARGLGGPGAEARLRELLRALDLQALAEHDLGRLSSGERQRVAIAAALMQEAPLLLLDEPSSHLDYAHRQMLVTALEAHAARGGLVVASLHELDLAWQLATHALLLQGPAGPPGGASVAGGEVGPDRRGRVWAGPREAVMTPERLSRVYGVPVAEVEVCGERRFWIGPRRSREEGPA